MNIYSLMYNAKPPKDIERKKAYIVGGGIAGLSAAVFLIDDAHMPGENITILEKRGVFGGCCDAVQNEKGYVCPGEREIEPYMECLWYLCSKIPSLEDPTRTILDETYEVNLDSPIHSECRCLVNRGHIYEKIHDYKLGKAASAQLMKFLSEKEEDLEDITIEDYFGKDSEFFDGGMWWCFHTMLAFKPYHSALEAQRYLTRFGLANRIDYLEGILHTKRNDNDSIIKPIIKWLSERGVTFRYESDVYDLDMDEGCNTVQRIKIKGQDDIVVNAEDLVFVTNGSMMTNARYGDNTHIAELNRDNDDVGLFNIWRNLARKDKKFGNPEKFLNNVDKTKWMSFFLTVQDYPEFFQRLEKMTGSRSGTGGAITLKDSGWEISFVIYDRDYYPDQREKNRDVLWGDGLFGERIGDYIKKPMGECTGEEILLEFLYHLNMLDMKDELLKHTYVSTCMMPYITSQFMPRTSKDRPKIVPDGCTNLAFIGQYVEVDGDVVFTIETSVRTPLEAVYKLTGLEKEPIELYPSKYDMRYYKERLFKFTGLSGNLTRKDLPRINIFKLLFNKNKVIDSVLEEINKIPPYYIMYPGRDKSVALKKSVLNPQYPKDGE